VRESAKAKTHNKVFAHGAEAGHGLGQMNRMAVGNYRAGAQGELLADRGNRRQNQQTFDMRIVFAFHAVRLEDQVVAHPNRIEAVGLGLFGSLDAQLGRAVLAKMRQQQSEF
jgi:hypothetical protein